MTSSVADRHARSALPRNAAASEGGAVAKLLQRRLHELLPYLTTLRARPGSVVSIDVIRVQALEDGTTVALSGHLTSVIARRLAEELLR
jgi:hypothetical protein